jgi:hypothetical protein
MGSSRLPSSISSELSLFSSQKIHRTSADGSVHTSPSLSPQSSYSVKSAARTRAFPTPSLSPRASEPMSQDDQIAEILQSVTRIYSEALSGPSTRWPVYLPMARRVMALVDETSFMTIPQRRSQQVWILEALQKLAFKDHDQGSETDIASWCLQHWLALLQNAPGNISALQGQSKFSGQSPLVRCRNVSRMVLHARAPQNTGCFIRLISS